MAIIVPNAGSVFSSAASVVGSADKWVWLGLTAPAGASASVMWYKGAAEVAGSELMPILTTCRTSALFGPYNSPNGVYAGCISGGCAIVWMKR